MASNALVTTRINENIKHEASEVLATMGLTVSDAVRLMLTKIAKDKSLPFVQTACKIVKIVSIC